MFKIFSKPIIRKNYLLENVKLSTNKSSNKFLSWNTGVVSFNSIV
jgi:hypothetical protein